MSGHLRLLLLGGVVAAISIAGCGESGDDGDDDDGDSGPVVLQENVDASELAWVVVPDSGGVERAGTFGDPTRERHGFFLKFPAGFPGVPHSHTVGYRGIVVQGRIANTLVGDSVEWLGPGSFWGQPPVDVHVTACSAGDVCIGYFELEGPFDFLL